MISGTLVMRPAFHRVRAPGRPLKTIVVAVWMASVATGVKLVAPQAAPVWLPVLAATFVLFAFYEFLGGNDTPSSAVFEIGFIYALAVWLYTCYPLVGFAVNGFEYGPFNDLRLYLGAPRPEEVGRIGWMYVVHLVAFVVAYSCCRGASTGSAPARMGRVEGVLFLALVTLAQAYFLLLGWRFQWNFTSNYDRYVALANLPQLTGQIAGHMDGIRLTAEIALLVFLFQRFARYRIWIFAWLTLIAVQTFVERQSRTELVLMVFASTILYDTFVRRVKLYQLGAIALAGLVAFNLLGFRRMGAGDALGPSGLRRLFVANEFETLFANAYDLDERVRGGTLDSLPHGFHAVDVLALVPQQLLSSQKITPADWYIRTMYPVAAEAGAGFCFGTVSESIVAWGWLGLLGRGAVLGLFVGLLHRAVERRRARSSWWFIFGTWLSVLIYHSFRNTTFTFVAMVWYRFIPVVVAVSVGSWFVRAALRRRAPARAG